MKRVNPKKTPVILAFDPSLTAFGYVVMSLTRAVLDYGCIETQSNVRKTRIRAGDDFVRRLHSINVELLKIAQKWQVKIILCELPHGSQSAVAAKSLGGVTGMVQMFSDSLGYPIEWCSENDAKQTVFPGGKNISKTQMKNEMLLRFDWETLGSKTKDEAVADSLAVYEWGEINSSLVNFLRNDTRG